MTSNDWDLFDTRHVVYKPAKMSAESLEAGYWRAYREFYKWSAILKGASARQHLKSQLRHVAYAAGWKKFEPLWDWVIRAKRVTALLPVLEGVLTGFGSHPPRTASKQDTAGQRIGAADLGVSDTDHIPAAARFGSQLSH